MPHLTGCTIGVPPCGRTPTRPYLTGDCCPEHTPAAVAGRYQPNPDPDLTLEAVARRAGRPVPELGPLPLTPREGVVKAARHIRKTKR